MVFHLPRNFKEKIIKQSYTKYPFATQKTEAS